ncbi:hypothetical protein [Pseudomonas fluorescens]|uniref:hypothetical protein n=1 Tax=Pseudomonas fluorescens TaxID=294 RepID=UPI00177FDD45|nr:hypothetical protein [Pseudomonas fluorescens]
MKKGVKLAHPSQCREIISPADLDRYLAQGWCELKKPVSRLAARQRQFRRQRKELGFKRVTAYLPLELFNELTAMKLPGETMADLLLRLIDKNHMLETQN